MTEDKELDELIKELEKETDEDKQPQLKEEQVKKNKEEVEDEAYENQFNTKDFKETKGVKYGLQEEELIEGEWLTDA